MFVTCSLSVKSKVVPPRHPIRGWVRMCQKKTAAEKMSCAENKETPPPPSAASLQLPGNVSRIMVG